MASVIAEKMLLVKLHAQMVNVCNVERKMIVHLENNVHHKICVLTV